MTALTIGVSRGLAAEHDNNESQRLQGANREPYPVSTEGEDGRAEEQLADAQ
jgi:hypothetical protein